MPNGSTFTLCTRTITCPTAGYVVAIGTALFYDLDLFDSVVSMGIMTTDSPITIDQDYEFEFSNLTSVTVQRVVDVVAGPHTFYLQAEALEDDIYSNKRKLTLMFFPTAYGSVDPD